MVNENSMRRRAKVTSVTLKSKSSSLRMLTAGPSLARLVESRLYLKFFERAALIGVMLDKIGTRIPKATMPIKMEALERPYPNEIFVAA